MHQATLAQARKDLADLSDAALHGETVNMAGDHMPIAQIAPALQPARRQLGSARGLIAIRDDFDAAMPDFSEYVA